MLVVVVVAEVAEQEAPGVAHLARKKAVIFFGWVFFLISLGLPHVHPMGRACGEPNEIELTAIGVQLNGSRCCTLRRCSEAVLSASGPIATSDVYVLFATLAAQTQRRKGRKETSKGKKNNPKTLAKNMVREVAIKIARALRLRKWAF